MEPERESLSGSLDEPNRSALIRAGLTPVWSPDLKGSQRSSIELTRPTKHSTMCLNYVRTYDGFALKSITIDFNEGGPDCNLMLGSG